MVDGTKPPLTRDAFRNMLSSNRRHRSRSPPPHRSSYRSRDGTDTKDRKIRKDLKKASEAKLLAAAAQKKSDAQMLQVICVFFLEQHLMTKLLVGRK